MEVISGSGLGTRSSYCGGVDLGKGGGAAVNTSSCCRCGIDARSSTLKGLGLVFNSSESSFGIQFPPKAFEGQYGMRRVNAAAATGNGAFTGGNRAEDVNEAMSRVVPPILLEKDSAAFRAILAAIAGVALAAENQRRHDKTEVPVDVFRQGRLVESRLVYGQTFVIRSYEIGADRTASIETMMNHFQVTNWSINFRLPS